MDGENRASGENWGAKNPHDLWGNSLSWGDIIQRCLAMIGNRREVSAQGWFLRDRKRRSRNGTD
jgi:hypothetical protein